MEHQTVKFEAEYLRCSCTGGMQFLGHSTQDKLSIELSKVLFHGESSPFQQDSEPIQK